MNTIKTGGQKVMNTPERNLKKNNFNSFSNPNTDSFMKSEKSDYSPVQNLPSPQVNDKVSKHSFVVDWQINEQDVKS
jgi:hypothetical protein